MIAKKLRNMVRTVFFTVQKGMFNSKKRGNILGKAFNELMLEHHSNFSCHLPHAPNSFVSPISCRPSDVDLAFVSPREYEFSCSSRSPTYRPYKCRRKTSHSRSKHQARHFHAPPYVWADDGGGGDGTSPLVALQLREFGGGDYMVDMEAEKFIQKFYRDLRLQKWMAAQESAGFNNY